MRDRALVLSKRCELCASALTIIPLIHHIRVRVLQKLTAMPSMLSGRLTSLPFFHPPQPPHITYHDLSIIFPFKWLAIPAPPI